MKITFINFASKMNLDIFFLTALFTRFVLHVDAFTESKANVEKSSKFRIKKAELISVKAKVERIKKVHLFSILNIK